MANKKLLKIKYFSSILLVGLFFIFGTAASAEKLPLIVVESSDPIFSVKNAAPGETSTSPVRILNHSDDDEDFQFEISITANPKALADRLFFKILDKDGKCLFPHDSCDSGQSVGSVDGAEMQINKIAAHSTNDYLFVLTFDKNAGNEFQNTNMAFDMKLGYEGDDVDGDGDDGGGGTTGTGTGTTATSLLTPFATLTGTTAEIQTGEDTPPGQEGAVKGEESASAGIVEGDQISTCQSWPLWVWVLALIVYFAAFLWRTFEKFKEQVEKREIRWKWQAVLAIVAFLFWYFFDFCREYWWFVISALVGGAIIYLLYLYLFRKNIREEHADVESGSEKTPSAAE